MTIRLVGPVLALALIVAACGDSDSTTKSTPVPTRTQTAATATAVATTTSRPTSTGTPAPTNTAAPTNTPAPTTTPTPDVAACADGISLALRDCVFNQRAEIGDCYDDTGATCAAGSGKGQVALRAVATAVQRACPDDATVRAAGFGAAFTVDSLIARLQSACSSEVQSLAGR